ncbi:hypothetical protein ACTNDG_07135 [Clostridium sp. HCP1S3_B4]|uniref:hypothetical protein n=1 Tax=unclassified Clostridium TaxID=2614128 RepID=UPI003F8BDBA7
MKKNISRLDTRSKVIEAYMNKKMTKEEIIDWLGIGSVNYHIRKSGIKDINIKNKLTDKEISEIKTMLASNAIAYGFKDGKWNGERLQMCIEEKMGKKIRLSIVNQILKLYYKELDYEELLKSLKKEANVARIYFYKFGEVDIEIAKFVDCRYKKDKRKNERINVNIAVCEVLNEEGRWQYYESNYFLSEYDVSNEAKLILNAKGENINVGNRKVVNNYKKEFISKIYNKLEKLVFVTEKDLDIESIIAKNNDFKFIFGPKIEKIVERNVYLEDELELKKKYLRIVRNIKKKRETERII